MDVRYVYPMQWPLAMGVAPSPPTAPGNLPPGSSSVAHPTTLVSPPPGAHLPEKGPVNSDLNQFSSIPSGRVGHSPMPSSHLAGLTPSQPPSTPVLSDATPLAHSPNLARGYGEQIPLQGPHGLQHFRQLSDSGGANEHLQLGPGIGTLSPLHHQIHPSHQHYQHNHQQLPHQHHKTISGHPQSGKARRRGSGNRSEQEQAYPVRFPAHSIPASMNAIDPSQPLPDPSDIKSRRYATSVDERNYLTVYEYTVNDKPIIWDYYTGYVHLTGIWKAIGNHKADIVKLIDNSPELEPVLRRVRGGFLKIQGTWVPYGVARQLAARVAWHIRLALIPLFGPDFPAECLQPHEAGFGQLHLADTGISEPRRKTRTRTQSGSQRPFVWHSMSPPEQAFNPRPAQPVSQSYAPDAVPSSYTSPVQTLPSVHQHTTGHHHPVPPVSSVSPPQHPNLMAPTQTPQFDASGFPASSGQVSRLQSPSRSTSTMRARNGRGRRWSRGSRSSRSSHGSHTGQPARVNSFAPTSHSRTGAIGSSIAEFGDDFALVSSDDDEPIESRSIMDSPPPMPRSLSFYNEAPVTGSKDELLEMLQATRRLQLLSAGGQTWPAKLGGGGFEFAGRRFHWDGQSRLDEVPEAQAPTSRVLPETGGYGHGPPPSPPPAGVELRPLGQSRHLKAENLPPLMSLFKWT